MTSLYALLGKKELLYVYFCYTFLRQLSMVVICGVWTFTILFIRGEMFLPVMVHSMHVEVHSLLPNCTHTKCVIPFSFTPGDLKMTQGSSTTSYMCFIKHHTFHSSFLCYAIHTHSLFACLSMYANSCKFYRILQILAHFIIFHFSILF